jgi:hypothetical protein
VTHAYPADLARLVDERLDELERSGERLVGHPRPSLAALDRLLSVAYQATLLREEERPVTFRLLLAEPGQLDDLGGPPNGLHRLQFSHARLLSEHELRRLAPAAKFERSLIGVVLDESDRAFLWGLAHSGPGWLRAVQGGRQMERTVEPLLTIAGSAPGRVIVSRGEVTLAKLAGGQLAGEAFDVFDSRWLPGMFQTMRDELMHLHAHARAEARVGPVGASAGSDPEPWADLDPALARLISQHFIRRIVSTMRVARHGGTIIVVPPSCGDQILQGGRYLHLKYAFVDEEPRKRFRSLILSALAQTARVAGQTREKVGWNLYSTTADRLIAATDEAIFELAHLVAGLGDVDGAVVMTQRFELLGFAAEILGDLPEVPTVLRASDLEGEECTVEHTDSVGTRHRSVYRFCAAVPGSLGIVVSHDGGVRFVRATDRGVTYWDQAVIGPLAI